MFTLLSKQFETLQIGSTHEFMDSKGLVLLERGRLLY